MTDQPNPYSQPEEGSGVPNGEAKRATNKRGIWLWFFVGCVIPFALIGLATLGLAVWVFVKLPELNGSYPPQ